MKSSLQKVLLLSLIGISSAQTSSWGEPFTVEVSEAPAVATSTDAALPSPLIPARPSTSPLGEQSTVVPSESVAVTTRPSVSAPQASTSSWGTPFSVDNSATLTSLPTPVSDTASLSVDTATPTLLVSTTLVSMPTSSDASTASTASTATESSTTTESESSTSSPSATDSSRPSAASGAAAPLRSYQKMTFAGVVAGAAGIIFV